MHVNLGGYHIRDIEFVGRHRHRQEQGRQGPRRGHLHLAQQHLQVLPRCPRRASRSQRGMTHDGLGKYLSQIIQKAPGSTVDIVKLLQGHQDRRGGQLPAGGQRRGHQVVRRADPRGRLRLRQLHPGVHRPRAVLAEALREGGPAGHRRRHQVAGRRHHHPPRADAPVRATAACSSSAPTSSTSAATPTSSTCWSASAWSRRRSPRPTPSPASSTTRWAPKNVHIGPSDYVAVARRPQVGHIRMEGRTFGDVPLNIELKLEVWDSPNSAGVVIDAVRCAKLALDHGLKGALEGPVVLLHEVAAGAVPRRRVPPAHRGVHRGEGRGATAVCQG